MLRRTYLILGLCLTAGIYSTLPAQSPTPGEGRLFVEVGLGYAPQFNAQIDGALGYRFANGWGLGAQYVGAIASSISVNHSFRGVGIYAGHTFWNGVYFNASAGKIIGASYSDDGCSTLQFDGGGTYARLGLGYRFRSGLSLGISAYGSRSISYDAQFRGLDDCFSNPPIVKTSESLAGYVFRLGYFFPSRNRTVGRDAPRWVQSLRGRLFADVGYGLLNGSTRQFDLAGGYRLRNGLELGGQLFTATAGTAEVYGGFGGLGVHASYTRANGVYVEGGVGKILGAWYHNPNQDFWDHDGSGTYLRASVGYRLRFGLSVGLVAYATQSLRYDYRSRPLNSTELPPSVKTKEALPGVVVRLGYHLPSPNRTARRADTRR